jgi:hypothetical protein
MGQQIVNNFDEFVASEYDIHMSNSNNDTQLYQDLRTLSQAAIQNGQAKISDLIAISQSESVQEIARRLEDSARKIKEENDAMQQQQMQQQQQQSEMLMQQKQADNEIAMQKHNDEMAIKREEIAAKLQIAEMGHVANAINKVDEDSDNNGVDDELDIRRTEVDENYKNEQVRIADAKLAETRRANLAKEEIARKKATASPAKPAR